ncbi:MAG: hypothetical protein HY769_05310, partial [Candidatus Stahlbacteria bacterium]|nr:hypothetical protein [Candidatus Stahlbacteria bacterium]
TTYPDFAQIEADPYTMNLSKYETYFQERRPFFIESQEVFNTPIKLFYSRRVGKKVWVNENEVKEIPIISGTKYTGTFGRTNFGLLSAYTDKVEGEPNTLYLVGRFKLGMLKNSEVGIIYSEARDEQDKQAVAGMDATFRTTELQVQSQFARSDSGNAGIIGFDWYTRSFMVKGKLEKYDPNFNIDRIGYAPWNGLTKYFFNLGPQWFNKGIFRDLALGIEANYQKEIDEHYSGQLVGVWSSANFTNNWGNYISCKTGRDYEMKEYYRYYCLESMLWSDYSKPIVLSANFSYTSYGYNYRRSYFAPTSQNSFSVEWRVSPPLSISVDVSNIIEWKPSQELEAVAWVFRPILQYAITKDMHLRVYTEPNTDTHIHQFNLLFSYNFRPKSWFYIALNETKDNSKGEDNLSSRIAVVKLRYLFFL